MPSSYDITFENVSFRHGEDLPFILKNIDLTMKKKQTTALVVASGCGKSAICHLAARLWDKGDGSI